MPRGVGVAGTPRQRLRRRANPRRRRPYYRRLRHSARGIAPAARRRRSLRSRSASRRFIIQDKIWAIATGARRRRPPAHLAPIIPYPLPRRQGREHSDGKQFLGERAHRGDGSSALSLHQVQPPMMFGAWGNLDQAAAPIPADRRPRDGAGIRAVPDAGGSPTVHRLLRNG